MINENFIIVGAIIQVVICFGYTLDTLKGKTRPNRVSWLLWATGPGIAAAAQISQGVGIAAALALMSCLNSSLVFLASFYNKKAVWKLSVFDYFCGALAILAIVLWQITKIPNIALIFSILADLFAAIPTVVKSYRHPKTESYKGYLGGMISAMITLLAIQQWSFQYYSFAIYILGINSLLIFLIAVRPRLRKIYN